MVFIETHVNDASVAFLFLKIDPAELLQLFLCGNVGTGLVLITPAACYLSLGGRGSPALRSVAFVSVATGVLLTPLLVALQLRPVA